MRPAALAATLSGRADERARLLEVVRAGLDGSPRAVLVHGEAGIGKTTLVRSVCAEVAADGAQVLWGQGLRFGAVDAMFHPLVLALERWLRTAGTTQRGEVLAAVPPAALILPSLGAPPSVAPSGLVMLVDALIEHVVGQDPAVLVVDDVQWADEGTRDALTYLVAGFGAQRLALVTTHRDEAVVIDGFQRWLGNLRRLRGTEELALTRLDEAATREQVAALLGGPADERLTTQVYERSRGNPYFSELLVRRADPVSSELPEELPDELAQALLEAWRGLSPPAREITRILAIGGRPCGVPTLTAVSTQLGLASIGAVREAVDHGVVVLERKEAWFRHPLIASVLVQSYLPGEAGPVHAAWARLVERTTSEGVDELRRLGDLALHHAQAGEGRAAFADLMAGAELAETLRAPRERADFLVRAADLWDMSPDRSDLIGQAELLERAALACMWVGRSSKAVHLMARARDVVPPDVDPLLAGRLVGDAAMLALNEEAMEVTLAEVARAVELTRCAPDSRDHAVALSHLARLQRALGNADEAWRIADESLATAERSGSPAAMSMALRVRTHLTLDSDFPLAEKHASACWQYAVDSGEERIMFSARSATYTVAVASGDLLRLLEFTREQFEWGVRRGLVLMSSCDLSSVLLELGDLRAAESLIRGGLAAPGDVSDEAQIRVNAGVLAVRQGDLISARDHLARVYELMPDLEHRPWDFPVEDVVELHLGLGQPGAAFELVERVMPADAMDSREVGAFLVHGAMAAAELVQDAVDRRDEAAVHRHREALEGLVSARDALPGAPFETTGAHDTVQRARRALFDAELARARGGDVRAMWQEAARACANAGMEWRQRLSQLCLASALIEAGAPRREVAELLREVHGYAEEQGATPLREGVEELAATARISLKAPVVVPTEEVPTPFAGLTAREREVLGHLVAHRTNAEIAAALFISEKTVSVHVSNLLRKTDTASRREVAALARRVGWGPST